MKKLMLILFSTLLMFSGCKGVKLGTLIEEIFLFCKPLIENHKAFGVKHRKVKIDSSTISLATAFEEFDQLNFFWVPVWNFNEQKYWSELKFSPIRYEETPYRGTGHLPYWDWFLGKIFLTIILLILRVFSKS
jgi:hypothetical protein